MRRFHDVIAAQRVAMTLEGERVGSAEKLIVHEFSADAVSVDAAVAPIGGNVHARSAEISIPELRRPQRGYPHAECAPEDQRYFVRRPHNEVDPAVRIGDRLDGRVGDERLRAENAFRLRATELV